MTLRTFVLRPSACVPLAMSLAALALLAWALAVGVPRPPDGDEGAAARLWQLLIIGQLPFVAWFAIRWLPVAPRPGAMVLALQLVAALASVVPVFLLGV